MRKLSMRERSLRRKGRRGVSPIIATILLVAITVVLAAVLYILISGLTKGPGNTPIGTAFALGNINEQSAGANFYYNTTVQSSGSGMTWQSMIFQVQTSGGASAAGPTTITVTNAAASCNVAVYTFATAAWTAAVAGKCASGTLGGGALVSNGAAVQMVSTATLQGLGDRWVVVGQSSYSGSAVFAIP